ncbi:hypothetical protein WR25_25336 isoform I [Diploscapter pachys]|uniref:Uncharacterized protein n=1 Tax=Diploscapter pachys TaxID=2018661 RepID=A0A2A2JHF8_9BILA|nr:hypothetical protein WR25_25336 isoform A [Diploscapter pachys]PAV61093.1 hypothetical protein WR25_25336 isoform F [Diploscapter pachys]PAV61095.1 hypothetical protein WR25_25336 isoform H [Diploscapter pachys]PAV61096.1 hypothetical protein WR25_25336 isoform I [Diploscapter pachys]
MKSRFLALLLCISSASSQFAWINSGSSAKAADDNQNGNSLDWARFFFSKKNQPDSKVWDVGPLNNTRSILSGAMPQEMIQQITEYLFALLTGRIKLSDKPDAVIHSRYFGSSEEDEDDEKRSVHKNAEVLDYETQVMINDAIDTAKQKAGSNKITKADLASAFAKQRDEPTKFANRLKAIGHGFSELSSPPVRSSVSAFKKPVKVYDEREFRRKPVIHLSNTVIRKRVSTFQGISRRKTPTSPNFARSPRITNSVPHLSYDPKFAAFKYAFVSDGDLCNRAERAESSSRPLPHIQQPAVECKSKVTGTGMFGSKREHVCSAHYCHMSKTENYEDSTAPDVLNVYNCGDIHEFDFDVRIKNSVNVPGLYVNGCYKIQTQLKETVTDCICSRNNCNHAVPTIVSGPVRCYIGQTYSNQSTVLF